jgi:hypothetical protein
VKNKILVTAIAATIFAPHAAMAQFSQGLMISNVSSDMFDSRKTSEPPAVSPPIEMKTFAVKTVDKTKEQDARAFTPTDKPLQHAAKGHQHKKRQLVKIDYD